MQLKKKSVTVRAAPVRTSAVVHIHIRHHAVKLACNNCTTLQCRSMVLGRDHRKICTTMKFVEAVIVSPRFCCIIKKEITNY